MQILQSIPSSSQTAVQSDTTAQSSVYCTKHEGVAHQLKCASTQTTWVGACNNVMQTMSSVLSCHVCLVHGLKSSALPATLWPSSKLYHNDYLLRALAASRIMELDLSRQSNDECCLQTSSEPILRLSSPDPGRGALRPWSSSINMVPRSVQTFCGAYLFLH